MCLFLNLLDLYVITLPRNLIKPTFLDDATKKNTIYFELFSKNSFNGFTYQTKKENDESLIELIISEAVVQRYSVKRCN